MSQGPSVIKVRYASYQDMAFIIKANAIMAKETEDIDLNRETLTKGVKAVFEDSSRGQYVIGEYNSQVAACLLITHEWSDWRNSHIAWIQSLFVKKELRRRGLFKAMFEFLEMKVAKGEYAGVRLYVDKDNFSAKNVYQKLGMNGHHYIVFERMK